MCVYCGYLLCYDESAASPFIIITLSFNHHPSPGSRREWVCERGGALKQPGLAACDEAHLKRMKPHHRRCYMPSVPLLGRPVSSPCMHAGVLVGPGRERRGIPLCKSRELPDSRSGWEPHPLYGWCARMPGHNPQEALWVRRTKPPKEAAAPSRPGPRRGALTAAGLRPFLGPPPSEHWPSFTNPTRTPGSLFILTLIPFGHFILSFMMNKSLSEAWRHTYCVCCLLFPPQCIYKDTHTAYITMDEHPGNDQGQQPRGKRGVRMHGGRAQRQNGGRGQGQRQISDEIRATIVNHVVNHGLTMAEAGRRVQPNIGRLTVSSIIQTFRRENKYINQCAMYYYTVYLL